MRPIICFASLACLLAACEPMPDLTEVESATVETAPYPDLIPLTPGISAPAPTDADDESMAALQARADRLAAQAQ